MMINGLDILLLLKLAIKKEPRVPSKKLAEELHVSPSEVTQSLKRCRTSGLLYRFDQEKQVNRSALLDFLGHGFRYVFPAEHGDLSRGIPTGIDAAPLKSMFIGTVEPPLVWPYENGTVRGRSVKPLHKQVPRAALADPELYEVLALLDGIRGERIRERTLALAELAKRLQPDG